MVFLPINFNFPEFNSVISPQNILIIFISSENRIEQKRVVTRNNELVDCALWGDHPINVLSNSKQFFYLSFFKSRSRVPYKSIHNVIRGMKQEVSMYIRIVASVNPWSYWRNGAFAWVCLLLTCRTRMSQRSTYPSYPELLILYNQGE